MFFFYIYLISSLLDPDYSIMFIVWWSDLLSFFELSDLHFFFRSNPNTHQLAQNIRETVLCIFLELNIGNWMQLFKKNCGWELLWEECMLQISLILCVRCVWHPSTSLYLDPSLTLTFSLPVALKVNPILNEKWSLKNMS